MANRRNYVSRLERKSRQKQLRQTFFWLLLTAVVIFALFRWGIPAFINLAAFYADWQSGDIPIVADDTVPPAPPRIVIPYDATNSAELNLQGYTEPGATVQFFLNQEKVKEITAESDGQFLISDLELDKGYNWIYATAIDQAQNTSLESQKQLLVYDVSPPKLTVEKPTSGEQFYGSGQKRIEIIGQVEDADRVSVNNRSVIISQNGSFSTFMTLEDGEQILEIKATDQAGNETVEEIVVTYHP